jgi:hypothetical protein
MRSPQTLRVSTASSLKAQIPREIEVVRSEAFAANRTLSTLRWIVVQKPANSEMEVCIMLESSEY